MSEKEEKPIRVVDRRMFTSDGELRPGFEPEEPAAPPEPPAAPKASPPAASSASSAPGSAEASPPPPAAPPPVPGRGPAAPAFEAVMTGPEGADDAEGLGEPEEAVDPGGEFSAIVRSLATTAYSALGLLADPSGARHREPAVARQMIEWLGVLESKTRNNLSFEESAFLSRVLYELRMAYVEVTRPPGR